MYIITRRTLTQYGAANAQVRGELEVWYSVVKAAQWTDFNSLRDDMPATDYVGDDHYIFNIKGNHYRLIALIFFATKRLYIRGIFTHAEYSKLSKKHLLSL